MPRAPDPSIRCSSHSRDCLQSPLNVRLVDTSPLSDIYAIPRQSSMHVRTLPTAFRPYIKISITCRREPPEDIRLIDTRPLRYISSIIGYSAMHVSTLSAVPCFDEKIIRLGRWDYFPLGIIGLLATCPLRYVAAVVWHCSMDMHTFATIFGDDVLEPGLELHWSRGSLGGVTRGSWRRCAEISRTTEHSGARCTVLALVTPE